jgi:hypothetical protein
MNYHGKLYSVGLGLIFLGSEDNNSTDNEASQVDRKSTKPFKYLKKN